MSVSFIRSALEPSLRRVRQPWRWVPFALRLRVARYRALLVRRRLVRRLAVTVVAALVGSVVVGALSSAQRTQALWGETVEVVAIDVDVEVGDTVDPDDFSIIRRPTTFVPQDVLRDAPTVVDMVVRSLRQGEVVTHRDLRSTREALAIPSGHRAVSLPLDASIPHLENGDLVDLYLVRDSFAVEEKDVTRRVEVPALVVEVTDVAVVLAVESDSVGDVATTHTTGRIVIALR